jgi:hypothetical protein
MELYLHAPILGPLLVIKPLNAELNPICHLLALLGGATIVVVSSLRVKNVAPFYIFLYPSGFNKKEALRTDQWQ